MRRKSRLAASTGARASGPAVLPADADSDAMLLDLIKRTIAEASQSAAWPPERNPDYSWLRQPQNAGSGPPRR